ncbi:MAG TPA: hypothetical protein VMT64_06740 [Candidatus Binataceae bacterium]|nr:hypothetical protein [Candidatus Binataceae bacterium]
MKSRIVLLSALTLLITAQVGTACFIDVAVCGYPSVGAAVQDLDMQSAWTINHPHTVGMAADGTYFIEFVLRGRLDADMCYAVWQNTPPSYPCPDSGVTVDGSVIYKRKMVDQ